MASVAAELNIEDMHIKDCMKLNCKKSRKVTSIAVKDPLGNESGLTFVIEKIIGNGSFGVVFEVYLPLTKRRAAIKKVLQDRRFKNRELHIMCKLKHVNVVGFLWYYFTTGMNSETYLNLVMEYFPETLSSVIFQLFKTKRRMESFDSKLYMYQIFRSLAYIHSLGIAHRDLKPQNVLLDSKTGIVKLCDFGSAKDICDGQPSVCYICSRFYRAPELIFGSVNYTISVDLWSAGCIFGELLLGQVLFAGENGVDQLVEIVKVLGTPSKEEIFAMNPKYKEFMFPHVPRCSWDRVFRGRDVCGDSVSLISTLIDYIPNDRVVAVRAMAHAYFDELRLAKSRPDGSPLPPLFDFTVFEMSNPCFNKDVLVPKSDESDT